MKWLQFLQEQKDIKLLKLSRNFTFNQSFKSHNTLKFGSFYYYPKVDYGPNSTCWCVLLLLYYSSLPTNEVLMNNFSYFVTVYLML